MRIASVGTGFPTAWAVRSQSQPESPDKVTLSGGGQPARGPRGGQASPSRDLAAIGGGLAMAALGFVTLGPFGGLLGLAVGALGGFVWSGRARGVKPLTPAQIARAARAEVTELAQRPTSTVEETNGHLRLPGTRLRVRR